MVLDKGYRPTGRRPGRRVVVLVLVIAIVAMQLTLPVLAQLGADPCGAAASPMRAEACCADETATTPATQADEHGCPDEGDCSSGCMHCPLPCCGGMPLALAQSQPFVTQTVVVQPQPALATFPRSVDSERIFHPPRC